MKKPEPNLMGNGKWEIKNHKLESLPAHASNTIFVI